MTFPKIGEIQNFASKYSQHLRLEVESNQTNFELTFIEFFELFFTFESIESQIFESNLTNFERIQRLKNFAPPYSWSRIKSNEFRIDYH